MTVKKASVKDLAEKAAAVKKVAEAKAEAAKTEVKAEVKAEAPAKKAAAPAKKEAAKAPAKKAAAPAKKEEAKAPAKKAAAPAKKAATKTAAPKVELFVEYQGGSQKVDDLVAQAKAASGKKSIKVLNVYYQPENNIVYFTADGAEGSFNL